MSIAAQQGWKTVSLGYQGTPYPTVLADGTPVLNADHVPLISSKRSAEEVNGVAFRSMPAPEHLPYFFSVLDAIHKKSRRAFMTLSEPGVGKSVLADVISIMMTGKSALCYECGDKRLSDLLFTTALTERPEQTLYDRVLEKVKDGKAHLLSIARLKHTLGNAFDPATASVDWGKVVEQNQEIAAIDETFKAIAQAEGINMQSSIALREGKGVIVQGYEEDRVVLADEYTDGKPDSFKSLNATLEWLMQRTPEIKVKSNSGLEYELGNLDAKPGFFVFLTGNHAGDSYSTSELPQSQHSRLKPTILPSLGKLGLSHRFCQMMTGVPLSTLHRLYGQHFETNPEGFVEFCKGIRKLGLSAQEIERIPAHQLAFLEHPRQIIDAADKCAEFFLRWQNKINLNSNNLPEALMGELSDDYVKANTPDPRLFDNLFKGALERAERQAAKDLVVNPGAAFAPLTSGDLVASVSIGRVGNALMGMIAEEIRNKTPQQPSLRGILLTDAVELGLLPSRQNRGSDPVTTIAQLLSGEESAPTNSGTAAQGTSPAGAVSQLPPANTGTTMPFASGNLNIGELVPDKGIFAGVWEPKDRQGNSLGKRYNVFAAPEDLTDSSGKKVLLKFKDAAREVANLKNWHGHNGAGVANDTALYEALRDGSYNGGWFIPTRDLLGSKDGGKDVDDNVVHDETLYKHRNTGAFANTFQMVDKSSSDIGEYYWSCSEHRDDSVYVWYARFTDGGGGWLHKGSHRLSCRPCRVELAL